MLYIDVGVLNLAERFCQAFQRLTGRTNVWLAVQLTNLSIIVYFVSAAAYFWIGDALFRLIFAGGTPHGDEPDEAMSFLRRNAAALAGPGHDPNLFAVKAWSIAHGLAMLMLDGQIPRDPKLVETLVGPGPAGPRDC